VDAVAALFAGPLITFVLVLARIGGLTLSAPLFGHTALPRRIRGLLVVALAILVLPTQLGASPPDAQDLVDLVRLVANETLVGLMLGMGVRLLFTAVQLTGQLISQLSGMSLADVFSPGFDADVPMFSQLLFYLTLTVMICLGGHRMIVSALLDTFDLLPPGQAALGDSFVDVSSTILMQSLALGIRAGAPVMTALLLSTLVLGLVTRTLPQINIIAIGFSLNALLTLGAMFLAVGTIAWTLQEQTEETLRLIMNALASKQG
jgi:flagellar biosynthetic protein FliR